ncbi:MAG: hypothetical protein R3F08_05580 [Dokdonella sp.]|nr:hypothetical protein [Dokdonella sp.]MCB1570924.1 hypothetical protein [Xanthomonadales bacterium]
MDNENNEEHQDPARSSAPPSRRIAFESLRERTDELELLISGISLLALLALPNWFLDHWSRMAVHLEGERLALVSMVFPLAIGLSYTLAAAFLLHLAVRAYWVGLIGLKAAFPEGIRWASLRNHGPIVRNYFRERIVDLETSIDAADRFASVVFAMISLIALSIFWVGLVLMGVILFGMLAGALFGLPESGVDRIVEACSLVLIGIPLLIILLDRGSALLRRADVPPPQWLVAAVRPLLVVQSLIVPQRLMLPVQLSLESNFPRRVFSIAFMLVIVSTVLIGTYQLQLARQFAPLDSYALLDDTAVESGLRSAHYENLRSSEDGLLREPMIPADIVSDSYLRLFIPHVPRYDNDIAREQCADASRDGLHCLASMWTVMLDDRAVDTATFVASERRDLGMRGLQGYVPLDGLAPGRHELAIARTLTSPKAKAARVERYRIPFWFAPQYQLDLPAPAPPPASGPPELSAKPES